MISNFNDLGTYKAIVVLNNTGVCLLQRQYYHEALITFKDALDLTKCAQDADQRQIGAEKAVIFLDQASARISKSTKIGGVDQKKKIASTCSITVMHQGDCSTGEILSTFPEFFHGFAFILVYDEEGINVSTDSAIILHNFSVSIRMKEQDKEANNINVSNRYKMIDFAYKIESAAVTILYEYIATPSSNGGVDLKVENNRVEALQLTIVVLNDLILLSRALQLEEHERIARTYVEQLNQLRSSLLDLQDLNLGKSLKKCSSSAQAA